jgi:tRNA pseudouridine38-40 synthase
MRYALALEYDGSDFLGWQKHHTGLTVQAAVEPALSCVANEKTPHWRNHSSCG